MRIVKLVAENVKKIKAIDITPKEDVVIISGKNGAGKTSVLDSIWFALSNREGSKNTPQPIRKGEKKASVTITLDDFIVNRIWTADDKSYLKVTNREGLTYSSPQELLDSFIGELTFDPLAFAQMKEREQRQLLLKLAEIDIDRFDEKIAILREDRRIQGQKVKLYEGERDDRDFSGIPEKEISITGLQSQLENAIDYNRDIDATKQNIDRNETAIMNSEAHILSLEEEIKTTKIAIEELKNSLDIEKKFIKNNEKVDIESLREKINKAMEINELVKARTRNIQADHKREMAQKTYDDYTDKINVQLQTKEMALKNATMPVKGLGISDTGVTYDEIPFSQLSSSEQLIVSLAMAISLNPKLRVIRITDGSLLDEKSMDIIRRLAKERDYQIWVEKVSDDGAVGFYIEEGEVVSGH